MYSKTSSSPLNTVPITHTDACMHYRSFFGPEQVNITQAMMKSRKPRENNNAEDLDLVNALHDVHFQ